MSAGVANQIDQVAAMRLEFATGLIQSFPVLSYGLWYNTPGLLELEANPRLAEPEDHQVRVNFEILQIELILNNEL